MVEKSLKEQNSVSYIHILFPRNLSELNMYNIMAIKAMRKVDWAEKLLVSYRREYIFPNVGFGSQRQEKYLQRQKNIFATYSPVLIA